jgi:hypothetical protein
MAYQESDRLIVAMNPVKAGGAKGSADGRHQCRSTIDTRGQSIVEQDALW